MGSGDRPYESPVHGTQGSRSKCGCPGIYRTPSLSNHCFWQFCHLRSPRVGSLFHSSTCLAPRGISTLSLPPFFTYPMHLPDLSATRFISPIFSHPIHLPHLSAIFAFLCHLRLLSCAFPTLPLILFPASYPPPPFCPPLTANLLVGSSASPSPLRPTNTP